ncbi:MAG: inositol-3-phosphate synthase [Pirellulales bacterium]|jgi:myo-inositol-1-phosphate synthase|nr:inositol-3-phosphate synthase [Pirellulales bacterium]
MAQKQIGLWLIGAKGGVATTVMTGLAALARGLVEPIGLITETKDFHSLNLIDWSDIVVGGHDIRNESLLDEARRMWTVSRAIPPGVLESVTPDLVDIETRLRPGTVLASGTSIQAIASLPESKVAKTPRSIIDQIRTDILDFAETNDVERVVVVNLASTEPPWSSPIPDNFDELSPLLERASESSPLPTSSLYAIAAFEADAAYINFTPSTGATPQALNSLAQQRGLPHAGCDGKTGETLLKSVLAPMFRDRHLNVMSWVGHNIFGNLDGKILDDPSNKAAKVKSKDHLLANLLPTTPQTLVSIEFIESLGDWKTAWDHIHFEGFLGTPMTMQFTWQGCDSILAAPLVIDLIRLVDRARLAGEAGSLPWLASFFKSPLNCHEQGFAAQMTMLHDWVKKHSTQP